MSAPSAWNTDIKSAPHGRYVIKQRKEGVDTRVFVPERVILSTKCGKVTLSHYLPEEKRWLMLGKGEAPEAWMPWPEPYSVSSQIAAVNAGHAQTDDTVPSGDKSTVANSRSLHEATDSPAVVPPSPSLSGSPFRADGGATITMTHEGIACD